MSWRLLEQQRRTGAALLATHARAGSSFVHASQHLASAFQTLSLQTRTLATASSTSSTNSKATKKRAFASSPRQTRRQAQQDARWREFMLALRTFYANEQHFAVPPRFVVPAPSPFPFVFSPSKTQQAQEQHDTTDTTTTAGSPVPHHLRYESWPKELHGLPLGVRVRTFTRAVANGTLKHSPRQLAELQALGFPWRDWETYLFETVTIPALSTYAALEGHLFVPQKFVVPHGDAAWPRPTWGVALGHVVANLRKQRESALAPDAVDALDALGFVWKVSDAKWSQYFLPGLRTFKAIHGHADVPLAFVIPEDGDESVAWPRHLRGYMLGRHVYMVRSGNYSSQVAASRTELEALGFSFNLSDTAWSQTIFPALEVFAREFGHCDVHQEFVVPSHAPWPEKAWGLKLGHTVKGIRQGAYEDQVQAHAQALEVLGFVWNAKQRLAHTVRDVVLPAMATYRKLHGHVLISTDFVVPENDAVWPAATRGFKLGHWITRARSGHVDVPSSLRGELDAVGFVWRFNDARWREILLPSFRAYAALHGSCHGMSTKFHVPHEPPYPERAWGANLGGAVWHMRNGDTYVHDDEKQRELRRLGVL